MEKSKKNKSRMEEVGNFLELIVIIVGGLSMPVIVFCFYFITVPVEKRSKPLAILFLIITLLYVPFCAYFSWKALKKSKNWERLAKKSSKK